MHPALQWLLVATGIILLRLSGFVGLIYFGVGILAMVIGAIMARRRRTL